MTSHKDLVTLEEEIGKLLDDQIVPNTIAKYISYVITGCCNSEYNQDLEAMLKLDCPFRENYGLTNLLIKLLSLYPKKDETEVEQLIVPVPSFNIRFKNQENISEDRPEVKFLYSTLKPFHNTQGDILDLYVDETFGINRDVYKALKIIPYNSPWYGFIHDEFISSPELESSLRCCKGLFVFSDRLKRKIQKECSKRSIGVKINTLYLPVAEPTQKFNIKQLGTKIIHISSRHEITFSFYKTRFEIEKKLGPLGFLCFGSDFRNITPLQKLIVGANSKAIPSENLVRDIKVNIDQTNKWNKRLLADIDQMVRSVTVVKECDCGCELDKLLSQNIVFCNIDRESSSAIRVLNECIVRNTPVIINKHPIAVELLGEFYPLYYDRIHQNIRGTISFSMIKQAHKYLVGLNKIKLSSNAFVCDLNSLL